MEEGKDKGEEQPKRREWKRDEWKTIINYHAHGQTAETIMNHHEEFECTQSEAYFMVVNDSAR